MSKVYVGIDLSYSSTGVACIHDGKVDGVALKAGKPSQEFDERMADLWGKLRKVLPHPDSAIITIEGAAYAADFGAFKLGELSGAVRTLLSTNGYRYNIVAPTQLKKYATGKGNAPKEFVAAKVAKQWGFLHPSNDVVDAFVLAKISQAIDDGTWKDLMEGTGSPKKKEQNHAW